MAFKSVFIAAIILSGFAYAGEFIFSKLGISLDSLRIAGGIMLFIIGLNMVFEKRTEKRKDRAEEVLETTKDPEDISVFPMGIPMIAGPGTMASLLILMGRANNWQQELTIMIALASVLLISLIAFLISEISFIISSSMANLPAVSIITRLKPFDFACAIAA